MSATFEWILIINYINYMNQRLFIYLIYILFLWFQIACNKDEIVSVAWMMVIQKFFLSYKSRTSKARNNLAHHFFSTFILWPKKAKYKEVPPWGVLSKVTLRSGTGSHAHDFSSVLIMRIWSTYYELTNISGSLVFSFFIYLCHHSTHK